MKHIIDLVTQIIDRLQLELPEQQKQSIDIFRDYVNNKKYRAAFLILEQMKQSGNWTPSETLLKYYERFWWEYAN